MSGTQSGCSVAGPLLHRRVLSCTGVGLSVRLHVVSSCRHYLRSCHFCAVARSFSRQFRQMCFDSSDATTARQKTCFRFQARARWVWQWHSGPHRMCRWYSRFLHGQPRTSRIAIPAQPLQLTLRNVYVWDTRRTHHCTRLAIQYFRRWELRTSTCGLEKLILLARVPYITLQWEHVYLAIKSVNTCDPKCRCLLPADARTHPETAGP